MFGVMKFSGIVKDQERKVERNGIIEERKVGRRLIRKLFTMKKNVKPK
jgi:hypothetical protein